MGRERELAALGEDLAAASQGRGRVCFVSGEAGVGKTRLADEFATRCQRAGTRVLWGRCWEGEGAPAYWPWQQIVRAYLADCDLELLARRIGGAASHVAQVVPELGERLGVLPPASTAADSEQARFLLFDAVARLLVTMRDDGPTLLVLDDVHWADRPSLRLLQFLAGELVTARLLVLATYREVEAHERPPVSDILGQLARESRHLGLAGFDRDEVGRLMEAGSGQAVPTSLTAAVHRVTDGNPFFVDEIARLLASLGPLDEWARAHGGVFPIPPSVRATIRRRLDTLPASCRGMLGAAAVIGREFDVAALAHAGVAPADALLADVGRAEAAGILTASPGGHGRYAFFHVLVRDTLYDALARDERVRLHRLVGETLEAMHGGDLEPHLAELAHHFLEASAAGDVARAIDFSTRAGARAMAMLAYEEAVSHLEHAMGALERSGAFDERRACELLLRLGEAQWSAGEFERSRAAFRRAAEIAERRGDPEQLARGALGFGGQYTSFDAGMVGEELVRLLETAERRLDRRDGRPRARVMARLAEALTFAPQTERKRTLAADAVAMARRLGDPATLGEVLIRTHWATWSPENLDERLAVAAEVARLGEAGGDGRLWAQGHAFGFSHRMEAGDVPGAMRELDAYRRLTETLRQRDAHWIMAVMRALRALLDGDFEEAERLAQQALAIGQEAENRNAIQLFGIQMAFLHWERDRLAELLPLVRSAADEVAGIPAWRCALAWMYAEIGDHAGARRELERLAVPRLPRDMFWLLSVWCLAETATLLADPALASILYEQLAPMAARCMVVPVSVCAGSLARSLGLLALTLGRRDDAERHLDAALAAAERLHSPPCIAHARAARARLHAVPGAAAQETTAGARFQLEGELWTIGFGERTVRMRDAKGLRYLRLLLAEPGREFHVLDLRALVDGPEPGAPAATRAEGNAGAMLDARAKAAYRRRLEDLEAELREAEAWSDLGRGERARAEHDAIARELARGVGLGGRDRRAASATERARLTVTRAITRAVARMRGDAPELARHLERCVRTGTFCSYAPPERLIDWRL